MELQAEAERRKRAQVLESEGQRQSAINVAEGNAARVVLESQAAKEDAVNRAEGQAAAVAALAEADAGAIRAVASAIDEQGGRGSDAAALRLAERYVSAFGSLARSSTTMLLPSAAGDASAMVASALGIYKQVVGNGGGGSGGSGGGGGGGGGRSGGVKDLSSSSPSPASSSSSSSSSTNATTATSSPLASSPRAPTVRLSKAA